MGDVYVKFKSDFGDFDEYFIITNVFYLPSMPRRLLALADFARAPDTAVTVDRQGIKLKFPSGTVQHFDFLAGNAPSAFFAAISESDSDMSGDIVSPIHDAVPITSVHASGHTNRAQDFLAS